MGVGWMARCPTHNDSTPSLSIRDTETGKVLIHCHAGCDQAVVIAALKARGLWAFGGCFDHSASILHAGRSIDRDKKQRTVAALKVWSASGATAETLAEAYLRSRKIDLPPPARLKFHPHLKHRAGGVWPAMIALVTRGSDDCPIGIHRTYIARDGMGKAPIQPNKMMLGPCRGGAVRLGPLSMPLLVGEGVETCLSAMQATGHTAWAALSTSGLKTLELPGDVRDIIILADGDAPGEAAARSAASRWTSQGRSVRIARAPTGLDFNDIVNNVGSDTLGLAP